MIIEMLLEVLYNIFHLLTTPISIPSLSDEVYGYIESFLDYITAGAGILVNYTPLAYLLVLFGIVLAVDVGIKLYHFVMWILRKIPVISVS